MPYSKDADLFSISTDRTAGTPARGAVAVTPSDTQDLNPYAKALKINADGILYVLPVDSYKKVPPDMTPVKLVVSQGEYVPIQIARVFQTADGLGGTAGTVTDLVALYD